MKSRYALLGSILLGILATVGLKRILDQQAAQVQEQHLPVRVLAASQNLEAGRILSDTDIIEIDIPSRFFQRAMVKPAARDAVLVGKRLRTPVEKGTFFRAIDVEDPQTAARLPAIPSGKRLITLQVDLYSGVGGHLGPGSAVDCIAILRRPAAEGDDAAVRAPGGRKDLVRALTVLEGIRVFNVGPTGFPASSYGVERGQYTAVTLIVTPPEAELLAYTQAQGKVVLVERSSLDAVRGLLSVEGIDEKTFDAAVAALRGAARER